MRKLVTIRKVIGLKPIEGADSIELAFIDGWQVVVKKNEFKVGDLGVYAEIDSLLPIRPEFEFMASRGTKTLADGSVGYRLRTVKLRGALSQGLLLPLKSFPELNEAIEEGSDVTELLGVKLFEGPVAASLAGIAKGAFPGWIRKTDQERVQNLPWVFEKLAGVKFEVTVKMDGSSCTAYLRDGEFGVCSRNLDLKESENTFWKMVRFYKIEEKLRALASQADRINSGMMPQTVGLDRVSKNFAIQGEVCGEGIQKNRAKITGHKLFVFDVFDIDKQRYLTPCERAMFIDFLNEFKIGPDLEQVPWVRIGELGFMAKNTQELLAFAEGKGLNDTEREGLVFKSCELHNGQTFSFKAISNKYLLSEKD